MEDTDAKADEKFIKTSKMERNWATLYFKPSVILGLDGPNVTCMQFKKGSRDRAIPIAIHFDITLILPEDGKPVLCRKYN